MDHPAKPRTSLRPEYFHDLYHANGDPWNFETSPYEDGKYTATLASLPRPFYPAAFEVGCSIGVLTERLAPRCGALLAIDVSDRALGTAAERCRHLPNVYFKRMQFPEEQPAAHFDLVVVSEVAYYWSAGDLDRAITSLAAHQAHGGHLVLVHWTPYVADYPLTGDQVHDRWLARSEYRHLHGLREDTFRLDVLERVA